MRVGVACPGAEASHMGRLCLGESLPGTARPGQPGDLHLGEDPALTGDTSKGFHGFSSVKSRKDEDLQLDAESFRDDFEMNELQKKLDVLRE